AVESIDGLSGREGRGGGLLAASAAQRQRLESVAEPVSQLGLPPRDLEPLAALQKLQATLSHDGSMSTRAEATAARRWIGPWTPSSSTTSMAPPKTDVLQLKMNGGFKKPCADPALRDPWCCAASPARLLDAGAIDLARDLADVAGEVGLSSAPEKSRRQRPVVDARPAIFWFGAPA
ncbi:unnamed protein product, partial [Prorocentrum cordatum]